VNSATSAVTPSNLVVKALIGVASRLRSLVISIVERCPSQALVMTIIFCHALNVLLCIKTPINFRYTYSFLLLLFSFFMGVTEILQNMLSSPHQHLYTSSPTRTSLFHSGQSPENVSSVSQSTIPEGGFMPF